MKHPNYPAGSFRRFATWLVAAGMLLALAGCASGPVNPRDPFEPFNRKALQFNEGVDAIALKPLATVYRQQVPPLVRTGVSNFFNNMSDAWSFVNSVLQLKFANAAENAMRVNVNTFFGLGGILDIASELNIERHREDFGQTLGRWGVPAGPFIMLPLLGPSTLRDSLALTIDRKGDPVHRVTPWNDRYELYTLRAVDRRSNMLRIGTVLEEAALDKYTFIRDSHMQKRRAEITQRESVVPSPESSGQIPPTPVPAESAPATR